MVTKNKFPILEADSGRLRADALSLVGRRIVAVHYYNPDYWAESGLVWPASAAVGLVDQVEEAVALVLDDGRALVAVWVHAWRIGLDVHIESADDGISGISETDVSNVSEWRQVQGRPIEAVGVAWDIPHGEPPYGIPGFPDVVWKSLFAIRLSFVDGGSVSIALGQGEDGAMKPYPHSLLVIHQESLARSFGRAANESGAFGDTIAP
jgi:hypothetical protein